MHGLTWTIDRFIGVDHVEREVKREQTRKVEREKNAVAMSKSSGGAADEAKKAREQVRAWHARVSMACMCMVRILSHVHRMLLREQKKIAEGKAASKRRSKRGGGGDDDADDLHEPEPHTVHRSQCTVHH